VMTLPAVCIKMIKIIMVSWPAHKDHPAVVRHSRSGTTLFTLKFHRGLDALLRVWTFSPTSERVDFARIKCLKRAI
jgi:hypothetical protein